MSDTHTDTPITDVTIDDDAPKTTDDAPKTTDDAAAHPCPRPRPATARPLATPTRP